MKNFFVITTAIVLQMVPVSYATVTPSEIFMSGMVLQREIQVPVWGTASAGEKVLVTFAGQSLSTIAGNDGIWEVKLAPLAVSKTGLDLVIAGQSNTNVFSDVVVGDVWLCSGQSNMEMSFNWGVYEAAKFKDESTNYPNMRCMKIKKVALNAPSLKVPVDHVWRAVSNDFMSVTATGYFFGRKLVEELDIPIGLIDDSWSGCRIEPFIAPSGFSMSPAFANQSNFLARFDMTIVKSREEMLSVLKQLRVWLDGAESDAKSEVLPELNSMPQIPMFTGGGASGQYVGMINPIKKFPIKGVIWYQGCSNGTDHEIYTEKMKALILGWRKEWGYEFPFYFVQLASFNGMNNNPAGGDGYAFIREAQRMALSIPKTGMAVTIDIGNASDIHPKDKLHVGERLASWALAKDYGKNIVFSGPLFKTAKFELDSVRIFFDSVGSGLMVGKKNNLDNSPVEAAPDDKLEGFALCGTNNVWRWADAKIDGDNVVVSSPDVVAPVAVRYAFRGNALGKCNLYNKDGFPASPFKAEK